MNTKAGFPVGHVLTEEQIVKVIQGCFADDTVTYEDMAISRAIEAAVLASADNPSTACAGQDERSLFEAAIPMPEKVERGNPWYFATCATKASDAQEYNYKWMGWQARASSPLQHSIHPRWPA